MLRTLLGQEVWRDGAAQRAGDDAVFNANAVHRAV